MKNKHQNGASDWPRYCLEDVKAAARGRWPEILTVLGLDPKYLNSKKHQPCPSCGGKDRFRFTDHKQGGGFICNHCAPDGGSGFDLLMLLYGYDFKEAYKAVAGVLGMGGDSTVPAVMKQPPAPLPDTAKEDEDWQPYGIPANGGTLTALLPIICTGAAFPTLKKCRFIPICACAVVLHIGIKGALSGISPQWLSFTVMYRANRAGCT